MVIWFAAVWMLRRSRVGILSLLTGIVLFELIQPVAIKSFGDLERLQPFLDYLPDSLWAMMNVTPDFLGTFGLAGYLALGFTHPAYLILVNASVIWFGSRALAGEMERGSIQFLLARPVSRLAVYLSVVIALFGVLVAVSVSGPVGMLVGLEVGKPEGNFARGHLVDAAAATWLLAWAVAGITLVWSSISSVMSRAVGLAIAVVVVSYVIDYFAALWSTLEPLEPFSIFDYYQPSGALASGQIAMSDAVVLLSVGAAGMLAGGIAFVRRDLPT